MELLSHAASGPPPQMDQDARHANFSTGADRHGDGQRMPLAAFLCSARTRAVLDTSEGRAQARNNGDKLRETVQKGAC